MAAEYGNYTTTDDPTQMECREVSNINSSYKCDWVQYADTDCHIDEGLINYTIFVYCGMESTLVPLAVTILVIWWLFLLSALAITADKFFCPSLEVMAKSLRMNDNVAGVTLLAFGNGAPDVFSALSAVQNMKQDDVDLIFGALLGSGIFTIAVVFGGVCLAKPFRAMARPFLRDLLFYLLAVAATVYVVYDKKITIVESSCYIGAYVIFVIVVLLSRFIYKQRKQQDKKNNWTPANNADAVSSGSMDTYGWVSAARKSTVLTQEDVGGLTEVNASCCVSSRYESTDVSNAPKIAISVIGPSPPTTSISVPPDILSNQTMSSNFLTVEDFDQVCHKSEPEADASAVAGRVRRSSYLEPVTLLPPQDQDKRAKLRSLLRMISPVDLVEWKDSKLIMKSYAVFKSPALFALSVTTPVVDYSCELRHNWNKQLQLLHCVVTPVFIIFTADSNTALTLLGGVFYVWLIFLLIGCVAAVIVFFTSRDDKPPVYHVVFAYVGFVAAIMWIKMITNEIVNLLQTFGVVFGISNAVLGLTVLAWGNCIGDLISNIAMARRGFPRTAISACFGGPLFNLTLGIGIPFTMKIIQDGSLYFNSENVQTVLFAGVGISLLTFLIVVPLLQFRLNRIFGACIITLYIVVLVVTILVETKVIHWNAL